jgi:hydrogenase maturation protein HypF
MTAPTNHRLTCSIRGTVQGVGFRPTLFRLAQAAHLGGWVQNRSGSVVLQLEGPSRKRLHAFIAALPHHLPPLARIDAIELLGEHALPGETPHPRFHIKASTSAPSQRVTIPADVAICPDCRTEIFNPDARRYGYPFATCTNCGPRYTVVRALPYDRIATSLAPFPLCSACRREYHDPLDRRFHAETLACPACGPALSLLHIDGSPVAGDPLRAARAALQQGSIVAVMALGGFQLAVDATNRAAIQRLRRRKQRPAKPLAILMPDLDTIRKHCVLPPAAAERLASPAAPIVILQPRPDTPLPLGILAPGCGNCGIMLPTTPLHHLLLRPLDLDPVPAFEALVMTSGNRHADPIALSPQEGLDQLAKIADHLLVHNREILLRCDDSVVALQGTTPQIWRRGRGYAPGSLALPHPLPRTTLAMGADRLNAVALGWDAHACLSPHIGDLGTSATRAAQRRVLEQLPRFVGRTPAAIVVDLHPDLASTREGESLARHASLPLMRVQHHHAHAAACLAEHGLDAGLALAFDGTGWGPDGHIWGAELLEVTPGHCRRLGTFAPVPLPGGDAAVQQPPRQLVARLLDLATDPRDHLLRRRGVTDEQQQVWSSQCRDGLNAPMTHAAGRLFDAVACLLGIAPRIISYEGEAAVRLEAAARRASQPASQLGFAVTGSNEALLTIDWAPTFEQLLQAQDPGLQAAEWALAFHHALAQAALRMALHGADRSPYRHIALTGGVFMNRVLTALLVPLLEAQQLTPLIHRRIPPNDGGIAYGQLAAVAAHGQPPP